MVTDAQGNIVGKGRNRIRERSAEGRQFAANRLAHAELNALFDMDWYAVDVYGCKLYSIIEPCPMCIGAVRMAHMQEVHYAVRDSGAGAVSLIDKTPFFASAPISIFDPEDAELEVLLMALQVEATYSQAHPNPDAWINLLSSAVPLGATLGKQLFAAAPDQQRRHGEPHLFWTRCMHSNPKRKWVGASPLPCARFKARVSSGDGHTAAVTPLPISSKGRRIMYKGGLQWNQLRCSLPRVASR